MKACMSKKFDDESRILPEERSETAESPAPAESLDAVTVYLRELVECPALTRDEERALAAEIARAKADLTEHLRALLLKASDALGADETPVRRSVRAEILADMSEERIKALTEKVNTLAARARESVELLASADAKSSVAASAVARAKRILAEIAQGFGVTAEDLVSAWSAITRSRAALSAARRRLFERNLRLVVTIARRFQNAAIEVGDLVQEGNIALMRAVESYDPLRGVPFASFAGPVIRRAMSEFVRATSKPVRVPKQIDDLRRRIKRAGWYLTMRLRRRPSPEEIATYLELPLLKVVEALAPDERSVSLDGCAADDDEALADHLADPRSVDPADEVAADEQAGALDETLMQLSDRDRRVLAMRYGSEGSEGVTLEDVGHDLGVTRERARQLEARALRSLRLGDLPSGRRKRGGLS